MNRRPIIFGIALLGLFTSIPAAADSDRHHRRNFDDRIAYRIEHGRTNGQLTHYERRELRRDRRDLARLKARFLHDDYLSRKERKILRRKRAALSDRVYELKHNDEYRHRSRHHRDRYAHRYDDGWWISLGFIDH